MMARICCGTLFVLSSTVSASLAAPSSTALEENPTGYNQQAPYDSFVCFQSSFDDCLSMVQGGNLARLRSHVAVLLAEKAKPKPQNPGTHTAVGANHVARISEIPLRDSPPYKIYESNDHTQQCDSGTIPYTQTLNPDTKYDAVFVSPSLLNQIRASMVRLNHARESCSNLIQAYNIQHDKVEPVQQSIETTQKWITNLSALIEEYRNHDVTRNKLSVLYPFMIGTSDFMDPQGNKIDDNWDVPTEIRLYKFALGAANQKLQDTIVSDLRPIEEQKLISDAQDNINLELSNIAELLFIEDRAGYNLPDNASKPLTNFLSGSWIQKGTVVITFHERQ